MNKLKEITIKLDFPIQLPDRLVEEVTIRRPIMANMLDNPIAGDRDMKGEMKLYSALTGLHVEDLRLMDFSDYGRLQESFASFRSSAE